MEAFFFEDYEPDFELTTGRRTIGETEIVLFASLTGLHEAPFMSDVDAAAGVFGSRVSPALLTMAIAEGNVSPPMLVHTDLHDPRALHEPGLSVEHLSDR